jgi:DeoR/GlpR family transcriptional regulator of sugar metabolism
MDEKADWPGCPPGQDGETVFLGSGTTVLEVARNLRNRRSLTVITNCFWSSTPWPTCGYYLVGLGGILRPSEMSMIGHLTEQALAEVNAHKSLWHPSSRCETRPDE